MKSDQDLYEQTLEQYNDPEFAKKYANNIAGLVDVPVFNEFVQYLPKGKLKILDIASAAGRDSGYLQSAGYDVTGIDYSNELIKIAKANFPNIKFVQGDFTELPFEKETFDAVWCKAALVHLASQELVTKSLNEFYRVLKKDGYIFIQTKSVPRGQSKTATKVDKLSGKERYFRYQEEDEFLEMCKSAGFKILEHRTFNELERGKFGGMRDENWLIVIAQKDKTNE